MDLYSWYILAILFALGAIAGSFLNCVLWRMRQGESFLRGRSYCPACRHSLSWRDLVPLASFAALAGRCRYCKANISWQYPAVEFATGALFAAAGYFLVPVILIPVTLHAAVAAQLVYYAAILAVLVVIFVYDLRWYLIPDGAILFGVAAVLAFRVFQFFINAEMFGFFEWQIILNPIFAGLGASIFFLSIFLVSRGAWMGFGDVKYALLMGLILGFPDIVPGLFCAFLFGAILGLGLIAARKKKMSSEIPFGPFLVAGTVAALFFSQQLYFWYLGFGL